MLPKLGQGGFSLSEVLVASAAAALILSGSVGIYVFGFNNYIGMQSRSSLAQDSLMLVDFLRGELQVAGGGAIRSWMGIWVEDNCGPRGPLPNCSGSDRITVTAATTPLQQCTLTSRLTANRYQVNFSAPGVCCLTPNLANGEIDYVNKPVMFTLNGYFSSRYVVAETANATNCDITTAPGQAAGGDIDNTPPTADWSGGMVTLTSVETLYWDSGQSSLIRYVDLNNNNVIEAGEAETVAIGVYDLQAALGYDFNPADGNVVATPTGVNDEWLYNAPGVIESFTTGAFNPSPARSTLLLVQVGVILGVQNPAVSKATAVTQRVLNGPVRTLNGFTMQSELSQLAPRNSFIFQ